VTPGVVAPGRLRIVSPREWTLWRRRRWQIAYLLVVDGAAMSLTAVSLVDIPLDRSDLVLGLVIVIGAMLHIEASRPIERARDRSTDAPHLNFDTIWMFAAALLVHPAIVGLVVAVVYLQRWVRIRHHVVHRQVFNASAAVLAAYAAMAVLFAVTGQLRGFTDLPRDMGGFLTVIAAGLTFALVNPMLVAGAIALAPERARAITPAREGLALESASIGLAILVAWALVDWPVVLTIVFGIALVLHGKVLQPQLRTAASTDAKTGVLNHSGWISAARQSFDRARQAGGAVGVLMIDLDHFKRINDRHGHLFGDEVLLRVARAISGSLPSPALVGRFGGEEFVVLLADVRSDQAVLAAERIRRDVEALVMTHGARVPVTASVGVAVWPDHGSTLDEVVKAADAAVYAAKHAGRNAVRLSGHDGPDRG
jgi:diguanylate cyclase (GGDEF)-like protein